MAGAVGSVSEEDTRLRRESEQSGKIRQMEKDKYYSLTYKWNQKKKKKIHTERVVRLVVTRGRG